MPLEIERKFLVNGAGWKVSNPVHMAQGYLSRDRELTVRVRVTGDKAWLTIKGATTGATRAEFEYEVPLADGRQLLALCDGPLIEKERYETWHEGVLWEVDAFLGDNAGLVVAEVELDNEAQTFECPPWLGKEVTDDPRYYNACLVAEPWATWSENA